MSRFSPGAMRRWMSPIAAIAVAALASATPLRAQSADDGRDSLRRGAYDAAIRVLTRVSATSDDWAEAQRTLVRTLRMVGKYDEAENTARRATGAANGKELWNSLGEALYERGKIADAEAAFTRAMRERASDSLSAALNLAVLHYERGQIDVAMKEFDGFIDVYNRGGRLTARDVAAVAMACRYLGINDPQLFKDALSAFDRAIAMDATDLEAQVQLGEMFLDKYNAADAQKTFEEVLSVNPSHPRALLGAARRMDFDGQRGVDSLVSRALEINPNLVDAHVFRAQMALDLEDYTTAKREVDRALAVNPASGNALAVLAAVHRLQGNTAAYDETVKRALALNPKNADLYNTLADLTAKVRQYKEAAELAKQGVALDAKNWRGLGLVGMNQLRLGQIAEGRKNLEAAFAGDPYDVWIKNTLDLLDTFKNYDETRSEHYVFMIEKSESDLLGVYLTELAEQAWDTFGKRYGYRPAPPVRMEVYRSHADFSVRTVGLAGLGALGVSFGPTLAFDSPAARDAGPFNWGSTVWHELAHTFTLGMTDHKVPRWLSEGLSVYEEHRARPGWGFGPSIGFVMALKQNRLVPVSRMNDGFMHPAYPEQIQYSYYQAALVCELIARDHGGDDALRKMLEGYKSGLTTDQVFERVLKTDVKAFDKKFDAYLKQRFAKPLAAVEAAPPRGVRLTGSETRMSPDDAARRAATQPGNLMLQLEAGNVLFAANKFDEAVAPLERAKAMFPEYGGEGNAYWPLAMIKKAKGDARGAAQELATLVRLSEADYKAHTELATLLEAQGDKAGAADALDRAMFINPYEKEPHEKLAALYASLGNKQRVVRERRALVALSPVDRPAALYQLAKAQYDAGDLAAARHSVLRSLEDAPNFTDAQTLLLTIVNKRASGGQRP